MVRYDSSLLYQMADRLYHQATLAIRSAILGFGVLVAAAFAVMGSVAGGSNLGGIGFVMGALMGGLVGKRIGEGRAFRLRYQAQMALVHAQVEENTRAIAVASAEQATIAARIAVADRP